MLFRSVIRMLILHDLVEIDVGDVPIHSANGLAHGSADTAAAEARAADRIFGLLPPDLGAEFRTLWEEFEAAASPDAIFAKDLQGRYVFYNRAACQEVGRTRDDVLGRTDVDLGVLTAEHVFGDYDTAGAQNRLAGTHRGLPVDIYELALTKGSGDDRQTLFSGLMASVELPRSLRGTTAVIAEGDMFAPARDWMSGRGRLRVRIEDPEFEKAYQVYGTDQIAARALLTPAFIERFRAMAARSWAGRPFALVQDNRLTLAIPRIGDSLFAPPSFRAPAASREALARLYNGIGEVLATVDTVIDLDHAARTAATD